MAPLLLFTVAWSSVLGEASRVVPTEESQQGPRAGLWEEAAARLLSSLQARAALDTPAEMSRHLSDTFF